MAVIDDALLHKLEKLSRLKLTEHERAVIQKDLENIIEMFDQLNEVDTENTPPLRHMNFEQSPKREDVVKNELSHEEAMHNVPVKKDEFIAVPKFLKPQ